MTRNEIARILSMNAQQRAGTIDGKEFGVDQGPFEDSKNKYVAYLIWDYNGDFFFDTLEEFLNGFVVGEKPIGEQLDKITSFSVVQCND